MTSQARFAYFRNNTVDAIQTAQIATINTTLSDIGNRLTTAETSLGTQANQTTITTLQTTVSNLQTTTNALDQSMNYLIGSDGGLYIEDTPGHRFIYSGTSH